MDFDPNVAVGPATKLLSKTGLFRPFRARLEGNALIRLAESDKEVSRINDERDMATARNEAEILQVWADKIKSIAEGIGVRDSAVVARWLENSAFNGIRSQSNIETVAAKADELLEDRDEQPTERPSDDWVHRFYEAGRVVSRSELQDFFAAMLAGEIDTPGSVSFHAIEVAKRLDASTADLFRRWVAMSALFMGTRFLCTLGMNPNRNDLEDLGFSYPILQQLADIGLIVTDRISLPIDRGILSDSPVNGVRYGEGFYYGGEVWLLERSVQRRKDPSLAGSNKATPSEIRLEGIVATQAGAELAEVLQPADEYADFTERLHKYLADKDLRLTRSEGVGSEQSS